MPIPSLAFMLVFLPTCLILYFLFFFYRPAQNVILLLASLVFYAFGQTVYVLALLLSMAWNYAMGLAIATRQNKGHSSKALTGIAVGMNILLLLAFQWINQVLAFLPSWFGYVAPSFQVLMPLGLAWYTLQAVGYCLDVYRGEVTAEKNPLYVGLHLAFFPKITLGPLVDYGMMRRQFTERQHTIDKFSRGLCRFVVGLAKKLLLADQLSYLVNYIFTQAAMDNTVVQLPVSLAWLGLFAFGLQLYYELSAFADMAIGLGEMFGFDLPENFCYPFVATNMTDFWRRWNITPLAWFRKYVFGFLPRTENQDLVIRNLLITWIVFALFVGGFEWTFVFWGVWNFLLLLAEHFFGYAERISGRFLKHVYTLLAVLLGFVLLRSPSLYTAGQYFTSMLGLNNNGFWSALLPVFLRENWMPLGLGVVFAIPLAPKWNALALRSGKGKALWRLSAILYPVFIAGLLIVCMVFIVQNKAVITPVY